MPGVRSKEFGPGWYDIANCARELENDYGVAVVLSLRPLCPPGHTEVGLQIVIAALRGEGGDSPEVFARTSRFRSSRDRGSLPAILYGLLVKEFADNLENRRREERLANAAVPPGGFF